MIFLYNIVLLTILIIALPVILIKSLTSQRFRYKIKDRFFPSYKIDGKNYMLFHTSSFGETKTILNIANLFEQRLNKTSVFSIFTDTGYKFAKDKKAFIMPIDLYPIYNKIFHTIPDLALFFETEIWPSYITFLKKNGAKLALINARMSNKSFKLYKFFSFLFKDVIGQFDVIVAKSKEDAERFSYFSNKVVTCGNIKQVRKPITISSKDVETIKQNFFIETNKPIFIFGSVHKEELKFTMNAVSKLKKDFFIIIAPRHKEYANEFYLASKSISDATIRSEHKSTSGILILDTMGELENLYRAADIVFIGGSTNSTLKGHNPIEPLVYGKFILCGTYMESFQSELEELLKENLIKQVDNTDTLVKIAKEYIKNKKPVNTHGHFQKLSVIMDCYLKNIENINK